MLGANIMTAASANLSPQLVPTLKPIEAVSKTPFEALMSSDMMMKAQSLIAQLPGCSGVDCSNLDSRYTYSRWWDLLYPGMLTVQGFPIPIASFKDFQTVTRTYRDSDLPLEQKQKAITFFWRGNSDVRLYNILLALRNATANSINMPGYSVRWIPDAGWRGSFVAHANATGTDQTLGIPDPAAAFTLKSFLAKYPEFSVVYKDLPAPAPTTAEYTQPGGLLAYLSRGGWLWSSKVLNGEVPILVSGNDSIQIVGCAQLCNSGCKSVAWPNGQPICVTPVQLDHDAEGYSMDWQMFVARGDGLTTIVTLKPRFSGDFSKFLQDVGNYINDKIIPLACSLIPDALQKDPRTQLAAQASQEACAKAGIVATNPYSVSTTKQTTPPPSKQKPIYKQPGFWVTGGAVAAVATGAYFLFAKP